MISIYKNNQLQKCQSLLDAMEQLTGAIASSVAPVISIVGAGGKTTFMHRLADEYVQSGRNVIVTTTTHIVNEEHPFFLSDNNVSLEETRIILRQYGQVWVGVTALKGKMRKLPDSVLQELFSLGNPIIIEADGAKRLPVKVPAEHEPVIVEESTHLVNVYGLDAIGKPLKDVCFRFQLAATVLNKHENDLFEAEDLVTLAKSKRAGKKGVSKTMKYFVVLNKADNEQRIQMAESIAKQLYEEGIDQVIISSFDR